jgi:hypothetical protein
LQLAISTAVPHLVPLPLSALVPGEDFRKVAGESDCCELR